MIIAVREKVGECRLCGAVDSWDSSKPAEWADGTRTLCKSCVAFSRAITSKWRRRVFARFYHDHPMPPGLE